ncbi:MAG: PAS domain S-box protein [Desulfatiglandaceae bacterium]
MAEAEGRFRTFFNHAQVGFIRTSIPEGRILEANDRVAEMFGYYDRFALMREYKLSEHFVEPGALEAMIASSLEHLEIRNVESQLTRRDGTPIWLRYTGRLYPENAFLEAIIVDITEEKLALEALRESEETARALLNATSEKAALLDRDRIILDINRTWAQRMGRDVGELIGRRARDLMSFGADETVDAMFEAVLESRKPVRFVNTVDGRVFDNQFFPIFDKDEKVKRVAVFSRDITEQKRAEIELHRSNEILYKEHMERKQLSRDLINLLEKDRRNFAMELHDQIGQTLTTLKMDLEMAIEKVGSAEGILERLESARRKAVTSIREVKGIAAGLRPSVLDDLGLVAAVNELCENLRCQGWLNLHLFTKNIPGRMNPETELAAYRIIQEGITNAIKHSGAKEIYVNLVRRGSVILIGVEDNGTGFDLDEVMRSVRGNRRALGLLIMEERAVQLGGRFSVEPGLGQGTHLSAEIPVGVEG